MSRRKSTREKNRDRWRVLDPEQILGRNHQATVQLRTMGNDECLEKGARQNRRLLLSLFRVDEVHGHKVDEAGNDGHTPVHEGVVVRAHRPLRNVTGDRNVEQEGHVWN